jgi:hypothetical protein
MTRMLRKHGFSRILKKTGISRIYTNYFGANLFYRVECRYIANTYFTDLKNTNFTNLH